MRVEWLIVALLAVGGCTKESSGEGARPSAPVAAGMAPMLEPGPDGALHGKVAERIDAPNYTYLRVNNGQAEAWTAVPTTAMPVGAEVTVTSPTPMRGFESKTLNRRWDLIYFGASAQGAGQAPQAAAAPAAQALGEPIVVAKATGPNAKTIAEVFSQKAALKDQSVSLRGKVVKVTNGVMGKNWLHVRDGSGGDATKDNDLTITTSDSASMNDEVTISGPVHLDRDFGAGYAYSVIIEDAKVSK